MYKIFMYEPDSPFDDYLYCDLGPEDLALPRRLPGNLDICE